MLRPIVRRADGRIAELPTGTPLAGGGADRRWVDATSGPAVCLVEAEGEGEVIVTKTDPTAHPVTVWAVSALLTEDGRELLTQTGDRLIATAATVPTPTVLRSFGEGARLAAHDRRVWRLT